MIRKGDRVLSKTSGKYGTAAKDEHQTLNGTAVYVRWDDSNRRYLVPSNTKNLIKL